MKLVCPSCGAVASAEVWEHDARWREMMQVVASLPAPLPSTVLGYLALFRPGKTALSVKKALRLTRELSALVAQGHIQVQGQVARPCHPRMWAAAMEQMVERRGTLTLPLKNHNYLRRIVWGVADETDRQREMTKNREALSGNGPRTPGSGRTEDGMSEIMRKYMERVKKDGGEG